jgi:hypothetical protein
MWERRWTSATRTYWDSRDGGTLPVRCRKSSRCWASKRQAASISMICLLCSSVRAERASVRHSSARRRYFSTCFIAPCGKIDHHLQYYAQRLDVPISHLRSDCWPWSQLRPNAGRARARARGPAFWTLVMPMLTSDRKMPLDRRLCAARSPNRGRGFGLAIGDLGATTLGLMQRIFSAV